MKKVLSLSLVLALSLAATGVALGQQQTLRVDGSTTVGPIGDGFVEVFRVSHPDVTITVSKTGSGDGIAALIDGRADIAMASREAKATEFEKAIANGVLMTTHLVALDGVAVALHPSNPVTGLTIEQIRQIYTGEVTNWNQLGGPDLPIVAFTRDTSSGTYETFELKVMNKQPMAGTVQAVASSPEMFNQIQSTQGAIGYVGVGFVQPGIKAIEVNGIPVNTRTIRSGRYPIARPLFFYTNAFPQMGTPAYDFVTFQFSEKGQEIVLAKGYVPVTEY